MSSVSSPGLRWTDVDLDVGVLRVRRGRQRPKYTHGCGGTCGRKHAGCCPQKRNVRTATTDTKSRAGLRAIGLPDALVALLRKHQDEQAAEKAKAAQIWRDEGWLFAGPDGRALNLNTDHLDWKRLLTEAGIRDGRLHDARHAAATVLLLQDITGAIRHDIAKQVDGLLWSSDEPPEDPR